MFKQPLCLFILFIPLFWSNQGQAHSCQSPNVFYDFIALGACLPDNIEVQKNKYQDFTEFKFFYKDVPIRIELGSQHHGDVYMYFGMNFSTKTLNNLPPMPSYHGKGNEIHQWHIGDENIVSFTIFSVKSFNVMINYQGNTHQTKIGDEFMESLFLITDKQQCHNTL